MISMPAIGDAWVFTKRMEGEDMGADGALTNLEGPVVFAITPAA